MYIACDITMTLNTYYCKLTQLSHFSVNPHSSLHTSYEENWSVPLHVEPEWSHEASAILQLMQEPSLKKTIPTNSINTFYR